MYINFKNSVEPADLDLHCFQKSIYLVLYWFEKSLYMKQHSKTKLIVFWDKYKGQVHFGHIYLSLDKYQLLLFQYTYDKS